MGGKGFSNQLRRQDSPPPLTLWRIAFYGQIGDLYKTGRTLGPSPLIIKLALCSPGRTRTYNLLVNSEPLHH